MPRGAQVIYPKDLGAILMAADIGPGQRVLEAGVGSGALSMTVLRAGASVVGYELREDFAERAQANVAAALGPDWGWDAGLHRTHYGEGSRYDFSEAMVGLLAPGWSLRTWLAPHYFGGNTHTLYTELNASRAFDEHWHAFGHLGWLHYGPASANQSRIPDRTDTLAGIGYTISTWDVRLSRDGIVAGSPRSDVDASRRRPAWILGASVAF